MISRNTILFPAIIGIVGASLSVTAAESEERVDSVKADDLVQVAFRKVDKNELLGGVSVLDMEACRKPIIPTSLRILKVTFQDGTVILFGVWTATTTVVISCWLTVFPVT